VPAFAQRQQLRFPFEAVECAEEFMDRLPTDARFAAHRILDGRSICEAFDDVVCAALAHQLQVTVDGFADVPGIAHTGDASRVYG
jgi:hypothetical protein